MPSTTRDPDRHPANTPVTVGRPIATRPEPTRAGTRIDAGDAASVSFAATDGTGDLRDTGPVPSRSGGREGHGLVAVGPGIADSILLGGGASLMGLNPLPIQGAKIHRPPLRNDILSRERLNDWLEQAAAGRLALIVAEAGFGKTTLLADWARNSARLTAWYRLEHDDRDWLTFIRHLVGSGRELDPEFAPETYGLLLQLGPGGPTQADIVTSLVHEMEGFGAATPHGLTLIFDDYHVVDGSDETDPIVRAILDHTGPGFSVVIASRSNPKIPLGRLRARGGVTRLDGDGLCFDVPEADRLFRDAYHQPLDADVISDLIERTEGWAALLSLVRTNLEESKTQDPRELVRQLSGGRGDLYDYVAEEVVGTLPKELQDFLICVSLLGPVEITSAALVYEAKPDELLGLIGQAEELGLIARPDPASPHRFHPLVQGFLQDRLQARVGADGMRSLHQRLGIGLEKIDWRSAADHYLAAKDPVSAARVIDASLEHILASGRFEEVRDFLLGSAGAMDRPVALILRSRLEFARGNLRQAKELAEAAAQAAIGGEHAGVARLNVATVLGVSGFADTAKGFATEALNHALTPAQRQVANATVSMWEAGQRGNLAAIADHLRSLAASQDEEAHLRYASVTRLNLAGVLLWLGEPLESLAAATEAEVGFRRSGSPEIEMGAALSARATALAFMGRLPEAVRLLGDATNTHSVVAREEASLETAKVLGDFGDLEEADEALDRVRSVAREAGFVGLRSLVAGHLALRRGDRATAAREVEFLAVAPCHDVAGALRGQLLKARVATAMGGSGDAVREIEALHEIAEAQGSRPGRLLSSILNAVATDAEVAPTVVQLRMEESAILSILAEELSANLHRLSGESRDRVRDEAVARRERWTSPLRLALRMQGPARSHAAALLAQVGSADDVGLLRSAASNNKALRTHAVHLSRRLAPNVMVNDLGVVEVLVGSEPVDRPIRRKVLGLLCFLLSRTNMAAARDEALDALWPDLGPDTASNSLHQTIFFLRRVFEPGFREGYGVAYVHFDGDVVSLNPDLIDSASRRCWRLLTEARRTGQDVLHELLECYAGRFALDFAYEDWATNYRDTLHAAVLSAIERAISESSRARDHERTIWLARAALLLDPSADSVELALVRAYKASERRAAAAEQYAHYSTVLREQLAIEPLPFEDL